MLTLHKLFQIYNLDPQKIKLVRHGNKEIPVYKTFNENLNKFEVYQSFQTRDKFKNAEYIAVFAPGRGTTAVFLGLWEIRNSVKSKDFTDEIHSLIDKYELPQDWHKADMEWYELRNSDLLKDVSSRLVVEWGKGTLSWVQTKDKEIFEIKSKDLIGEFVSYDAVQLKFAELQKIIKNQVSNFTWHSTLSAVNGIYLIKDLSTRKLYVGSAYGENGIWGRWTAYANNGHGGNIELKSKDPAQFEFSILEIVSSTVSFDTIIERENRWKKKLGTREFGLNSN